MKKKLFFTVWVFTIAFIFILILYFNKKEQQPVYKEEKLNKNSDEFSNEDNKSNNVEWDILITDELTWIRWLNSEYYTDNTFVYKIREECDPWSEEECISYLQKTGIDLSSFEKISDYHAKDKNGVYVYWERKNNIDPKTYKLLEYDSIVTHYWRDKDRIYYVWNIIEWADFNSFKVISRDKAQDDFYLYENWNRLEHIDGKSYKILLDRNWENTPYWKDAKHIYYNSGIMYDLDYDTFSVISTYTTRDKNHIYFWWKIAEIWDVKSFEKLYSDRLDHYHWNETSYGKDKKYIYFKDEIIKEADYSSFVATSFFTARDQNNIYVNWDKQNRIRDFESYERIFPKDNKGTWGYSKDKHYIYHDKHSAENRIYLDIVKWIDKESFVVIGHKKLINDEGEIYLEYDAEDINYFYYFGERIQKKEKDS